MAKSVSSQTAGDLPASGGLSARQQLLLAELRGADGELSGQELHARLRGGSGAMGLATVYRHLRQLQQRGMVRCRHLPSGEALFAP
ncbi:MAG: transcriptional repressor, partial [Cyanobium sp.]